MVILGARDGTAFSEGQQDKFGVNEAGDIQDASKYEKAIASLQEVRQRMTEAKIRVLSLDDFIKKSMNPMSIVHLKGFGHGLEDKYEEDILKTIARYQVLVWDGDEYETTGFTKMVPKFLDANAQGECVAFKLDYEVDDFKESWADVIEQYPDRISIVSIDMKLPSLVDAQRLGVLEEMSNAAELPDWAREYFLLGRVACQATRSSLVISMGGGGISKSEAQAGIAVGVEWEIIDLRRAPSPGNPTDADGWRDEQGRALMDWVRDESGKVGSSIRIETSGQTYRLRQASPASYQNTAIDDSQKENTPSPAYTVLMPVAGWSKAQSYLNDLRAMKEQPGKKLLKQLGDNADFVQIDHINLVQHLLQTKHPQIFAESAVRGDGSDWNLKELSLLGDVSFAVPVRIFDNGAHVNPIVHSEPFVGTLLYTCGALLRPDFTSADWEELVAKDLSLDQRAYFELYERRLFPCFQYANDCAEKTGRGALITIPGLGCGQFAGRFQGTLGAMLSNVLKQILETHGHKWPRIRIVYFDAFKEGTSSREVIKGTNIDYIVQPLGKSGSNGRCQLCPPQDYEGAVGGEADDFSGLDLFSVVAWDHVSWPGNDYWAGSRETDDGVKAAATDSMYKLSGVEGSYDEKLKKYMPPPSYKSWNAVLKRNKIRLDLSSLAQCTNGTLSDESREQDRADIVLQRFEAALARMEFDHSTSVDEGEKLQREAGAQKIGEDQQMKAEELSEKAISSPFTQSLEQAKQVARESATASSKPELPLPSKLLQ